jgi:hypothetical protein
LAWEPKGTVLAAGDDRALRLYDARTGQALGAFPCLDVVLALWFHPAEPLLLAADRGCGTGVPNVYRLEVVTPPVPENRRDPG